MTQLVLELERIKTLIGRETNRETKSIQDNERQIEKYKEIEQR